MTRGCRGRRLCRFRGDPRPSQLNHRSPLLDPWPHGEEEGVLCHLPLGSVLGEAPPVILVGPANREVVPS